MMDHDHGGQYFAICSLCGYPHNPQNKCPVTLTDKIRKDQEGAGSIVIDLNDLAKENAAFAARIRELEERIKEECIDHNITVISWGRRGDKIRMLNKEIKDLRAALDAKEGK